MKIFWILKLIEIDGEVVSHAKARFTFRERVDFVLFNNSVTLPGQIQHDVVAQIRLNFGTRHFKIWKESKQLKWTSQGKPNKTYIRPISADTCLGKAHKNKFYLPECFKDPPRHTYDTEIKSL